MTDLYLASFSFEDTGYYDLRSENKKKNLLSIAKKLERLQEEIMREPDGNIVLMPDGSIKAVNFSKPLTENINTLLT